MKRIAFYILRIPSANRIGAFIVDWLRYFKLIRPEFVFPYLGVVTLAGDNTRNAFSMWSDGSDTISARLKSGGIDNYEVEVRPVFEKLVSHAKIFIDIGANTGFYSLVAWAVNPDCQIHAFEPFPKAVDALKKNISINHADSIHFHQIAASNITREGSFYVPKAVRISTGGSEFKSQAEECEEIPARFIRLDDFMDEQKLDHVDLIKIDTEYTEPLVIEGALRTIRSSRPAVLIEILNDIQAEQIQGQFADLNYDLIQLRPEGPKLLDSLCLGTARDTNCNFLLAPR